MSIPIKIEVKESKQKVNLSAVVQVKECNKTTQTSRTTKTLNQKSVKCYICKRKFTTTEEISMNMLCDSCTKTFKRALRCS